MTVVDAQDNPLPAAEVTLQVTFPDGASDLKTAVTDTNGRALFTTKTKIDGLYETAVPEVSKQAWTYLPAQNVASSAFLTIT